MLEVDPSIHSLLAFLQYGSDPSPFGSEAPATGIYWPESSHNQRLPHGNSQIVRPKVSFSLSTYSGADAALTVSYPRIHTIYLDIPASILTLLIQTYLYPYIE